jgi:hypothetical protein
MHEVTTNLKMLAELILKLGFTTGFWVWIIFYAAWAGARALRVPAHKPSPKLVRAVESQKRERKAA